MTVTDEEIRANENHIARDVVAVEFAKILLRRWDELDFLKNDDAKDMIAQQSYKLAQAMLEQSALYYGEDMKIVNAEEGVDY